MDVKKKNVIYRHTKFEICKECKVRNSCEHGNVRRECCNLIRWDVNVLPLPE